MKLLNAILNWQEPAQNSAPNAAPYASVGAGGMVAYMAATLSRSSVWFSQNRYPSPYVWSGPLRVRSGTFLSAWYGRVLAVRALAQNFPFVFRIVSLWWPKTITKQRGRTKCGSKQYSCARLSRQPWRAASGTTLNAPVLARRAAHYWRALRGATCLRARLSARALARCVMTSICRSATKPKTTLLSFIKPSGRILPGWFFCAKLRPGFTPVRAL